MTPEQRDLARHALGLPNRSRRTYRNHYVTGSGPDHAQWMALVEAGDARRHPGNEMTGGEDCFVLTRPGAEKALDKRERLDPAKFPQARAAS